MLNGIRERLAAPVYGDEERTRVAGLLNTLLLATAFISILLLLVLPWLVPGQRNQLLVLAPISPVALGLFLLLRQGVVRLVAHLYSWLIWMLVTFISITGEGVRSVGLAGYVFVIMAASLLLGRGFGIGMAALSAFVGLVLALLERSGDLLAPTIGFGPVAIWAMATAIFFIVVVVVDLATRSIQTSLARARASELNYRNLMDQAADGIFISDRAGNLEFVNARCCMISGYTTRELKAMNVLDLVSKESLRQRPLQLNRLWYGEIFLEERPLIRKDGEIVPVEISARTLKDGRIQAVVRDVSERKRAEDSLQKSIKEAAHGERLLLALSQAAQAIQRAHTPDQVYEIIGQEMSGLGYEAIIFAINEDGQFLSLRYTTFASSLIKKAEKLTDLSLAAFRLPLASGDTFRHLVRTRQAVFIESPESYIAEAVSESLAGQLVELLEVNQAIGAPIITGETLFGLLFVIGEKLRETDVPAIAVLANQMGTALENAQLVVEIQQQAQRLQRILDSIPDGVLLLDRDYKVQLANPAGEALLTILVGASVDQILHQLAGQPLVALLKDGTKGVIRQELSLADTGRTFELSAQPLVVDRQPAGWVIVLHESTEDRERQAYQQAQERLAMVGQLASGVAHDFNNILSVITLYSRLVMNTVELEPKNQERLATIHQQAKHASNLIGQILDFSRRSLMERTSFSFMPFLDELLILLERTLPENIAIELQHDGGQYVIDGDPARLQQVLMNLSVNARDAMPNGGDLRLDLQHFRLRTDHRPPLPGMSDGDWLRLKVTDSGTGIEPQHLPHVFEPFFTTKRPGQGTGLGLAQVYGIVRQHGGYIDIASRLNEGTTVTIYLPVLKLTDTSPLDPGLVDEKMVSGQGEMVLVVEDDAIARMAIRDTLETLRYQVLEAINGEEALLLYEQHKEEIALVLSDLVMPGMGGDELLRLLRDRDQELKIIVMTGYPLKASGLALIEGGVEAWLAKPFTAEAMAEAMQTALS